MTDWKKWKTLKEKAETRIIGIQHFLNYLKKIH